MKKYVKGFMLRGSVACGFGPLVLAVFYLIMKNQVGIEFLSVEEVCTGIVSLSALAFIAGGMNMVYQIERLPLMTAISIHGGVLYVSYLATYLINGWLERGTTPIIVFTLIFLVGYLTIWAFIFFITKQRTAKVNAMLKKKQEVDALL